MNALYKTIASVIIMSNFINPLAYAAAHTQTNTKEIKTKEINPYSYAVQKILQEINQSADYLGIKWVKGGVESASKYNLSIFSVLSETSKNVIFTQGRFDYSKEIGKTLNIGFGSRQLFTVVPQLKDILGGDEIMLGANVFFDSKSANKGLFSSAHRRYSVGLELQAPKYDFYGNIYRGQSDFINNERVLSGYDFGVVANIPMIPNAKVSVSRYDFSSDVTGKTGNKFRAEYYVNAGLSFGGEYDKSDQNNSSSKLFMNFTHHFGNNSDDKTYTANTVKVWDKRYNEVKRINEVYVEKRLKQIIEIENPTAVEWGTPFNVADLVTGVKGGAKVTYSILDGGNTGATTDSETGIIENTKRAGAVIVNISISATNKYAATSREIDVEFIAKASTSGDLVHGIDHQTDVKWGSSSIAPTKPGSWAAETHGDIVFKISSHGTTGGNATIDDETTGVISGTENAGVVTVTVAIKGGTKYAAGDVGTFDVTFIAKESTSEDLDHGIDHQTGVKWGSSSIAPTKPGSWAAETHGDIVFKISSHGTTGGNATINDETTGVISGTENAGVVTVTVAIKGGTKYAAGDVGTFDVTFIPKDSTSGDLVHGIDHQEHKWGTSSAAPTEPSWVGDDGYGDLKYKANLDATGGQIDEATGEISDTTDVGTVTVTAFITGGTKYAAGDVGTYTVTFIPKDSTSVDLVHGIDHQEHKWGTSSAAPTEPSWVGDDGYGDLKYKANLDATGGQIDEATGEISDTTDVGTVTVTAFITGGTKYAAGDVGTYTVTFIPKASTSGDLVHGIDHQEHKWGTSSAAPTEPSWVGDDGYGDLKYKANLDATGGQIDEATGEISDTTDVGTVTVTAFITGGTKYAAGDVGTYTVTFIPKDSTSVDLVHGITDQAGVKWGSSSAAPTKPGSWAAETHGDIVFKISSHGTTGGNATINDETTGVISGTENAGVVTVTVAIKGGTKYAAGDVGTFDVEFIAKPATDLSYDFSYYNNNQEFEWGDDSSPIEDASWLSGDEHGDIELMTSGKGSVWRNISSPEPPKPSVASDGVISGTTQPGAMVVMVHITGGTKYAAGEIDRFNVVFTKKLGVPLNPVIITQGFVNGKVISVADLLDAIVNEKSGSTVKSVSIKGDGASVTVAGTTVTHAKAGDTVLTVTLANDLYEDIAVEVTVTIN